jgi:hypothetical protein
MRASEMAVYEHRTHPLLPRAKFLQRLATHVGIAMVVVAGSLIAGMAGYWYFEGLSWLDAFLNAAMLLGGMGPVESPSTPGGKLFAGCYALYAGMVVLAAVAIILAPVLHRWMHHFHLEAGRLR